VLAHVVWRPIHFLLYIQIIWCKLVDKDGTSFQDPCAIKARDNKVGIISLLVNTQATPPVWIWSIGVREGRPQVWPNISSKSVWAIHCITLIEVEPFGDDDILLSDGIVQQIDIAIVLSWIEINHVSYEREDVQVSL